MSSRMLAGVLVALTALLFAPAPSQAQSTVTETRVGGSSWYSGTVGGQPLSGSSQRIGSFEYTTITPAPAPRAPRPLSIVARRHDPRIP